MSLKELIQQQLLEAAYETSSTVKLIYKCVLHIVVIVTIAGAGLVEAWVDDPLLRGLLWFVELVIVGKWVVHEMGLTGSVVPGLARLVKSVLPTRFALRSGTIRSISWWRAKR
jgi:hypothetical protein